MKRIITLSIFLLFVSMILSACASTSTIAGWPGVSYHENNLYIAYHQQIISLDASSGAEKWRFPAEVNNKIAFYAPPAITPDGKQLIVGGYDHVLYSLNPKTGQQIWQFTESKYSYVASPLVTADRIFAPTSGKVLYALNHKGEKIWEFSAEHAVWATPLLDDSCQCLYVAGMDHRLYAIQTQDGSILWKTDKLEGSIVSSPVMDENGILYFGTFGNTIHAFDPKSQTDLWTYKTPKWIWGSPTIKNGVLYATDLAGEIIALDLQKGTEIWKFDTKSPITASPLLLEDRIVIGNEAGNLYAFDYQGNQMWMKTFDGKLLAAPLSANGKIILPILSKDNVVITLDLNGAEQWTFSIATK